MQLSGLAIKTPPRSRRRDNFMIVYHYYVMRVAFSYKSGGFILMAGVLRAGCVTRVASTNASNFPRDYSLGDVVQTVSTLLHS
jgi:hypothetical protein